MTWSSYEQDGSFYGVFGQRFAPIDEADLSLTNILSNSKPLAGAQVIYTITVNNAGPQDASGVIVTDLLPAGVTYENDDSSGAYVSGTGVWTIGALANGGTATLNITVRVTAAGAVTNTAEITSSDLFDGDSTPGNQVPSEDDQADAVFSTGCEPNPLPCNSTDGGSLKIKDNADPAKRKLTWKWNKGMLPMMQSDFGDPLSGSTAYTLCIYDKSAGVPALKMEAAIYNGGTCGTKPCWKEISDKGWGYKNSAGNADGIRKLSLKGGDVGKSKVKLSAKGLNVPAPLNGTQYFEQDTEVIVQLFNSSSLCWKNTFVASGTKKNSGEMFKSKAP